MIRKTRSARQEQRRRAEALRNEGCTWVEVAETFRCELGVNARVAFRIAHGWSQREVADRWSRRWPADPKTDKNVSYWELWPFPTGHAPSLEVLSRLAELYECSVADLLVDAADYRDADPAQKARSSVADLPALLHSDPTEPTDKTSETVSRVAERVHQMDVHAIARGISEWSRRVAHGSNTKGLLLKVSAGLSLAASMPSSQDTEGPFPEPATTHGTGSPDYSGIWHSRYLYYSTGRDSNFNGEHYVVLRHEGTRLRGQSLPHTTGSQLELDLTVEGTVTSGTWSERTSPTGYYRGATYHGTMQLLVNPMGTAMSGKWVGFGKNFKINTGEWELSWVDHASSTRTLRDYHMRV